MIIDRDKKFFVKISRKEFEMLRHAVSGFDKDLDRGETDEKIIQKLFDGALCRDIDLKQTVKQIRKDLDKIYVELKRERR